MIDSRIESLRPEFQPRVRRWVEIVELDILPLRWPGYSMRITETLRTLSRQADVLAARASSLRVGMHNFGLAFDFAIFHPSGTQERDDRTGTYLACGFLGMALGLRWGGNWDQDKNIGEGGENDLGHLEWRPNGITLAQLKAEAGLA